MNHVNMNGINPGGPMAMTNGANGAAPRAALEPERDAEMKVKLNTYIYDYLIKNEQWDVARALHKSSMTVNTKPGGRRQNGMDDNAMEDSKDDIDSKKPADLPAPGDVPSSASDNSFLFDWFSIFWDIFLAPRQRGKVGNPAAFSYVEQTRVSSVLKLARTDANYLIEPSANAPRADQPDVAPAEHARPGAPRLCEHDASRHDERND